MLDRIEFLISEAFASLRRNWWMTFAAITTSAVALFLLGGIGYAYLRTSTYVSRLPSKFTIEAFFKDGTAEADIKSAKQKIESMGGVKFVEWIPRDVFWKQFKAENPTSVTEGLENPLPDKLIITLTELQFTKSIADQVQDMPVIEPQGVKYLDEERRMLTDLLALLRGLGIGAGGLMLLTAGILIYNAIRLTIVSRRREIRIMQLVGATRLMIATPLLIEGLVQGVVGGLIATALLWSTQVGLQSLVETLSAFGKIEAFPIGVSAATLTVLGALYGLLCSSLAARECYRSR